MAELTPMMRQYYEIKERHPDCLLFFRLGDFYEMFHEDARVASKELDLTLTTRDRNKPKEEQTPMCGVPYHSAEAYIARLVQRGYKVAISEQMEDPATTKGLVKRDITRIVTPGTVVESSMLDESRNNYFACVYGGESRYGICFCDVSTGAFYATLAEGTEVTEQVVAELGRFAPAEVLRGGLAAKNEALTTAIQERLSCCAGIGIEEIFESNATAELVSKQFEKSLQALGIGEYPEVWRAAGALLHTLRTLQKADLGHVRELEFYIHGRYMELDLTARRNLELTETLRVGEKRGSLLWVLDHTKSAMGSRMLRSWLEKPLLNPKAINKRLEAVEELSKDGLLIATLQEQLRCISDLERIMARIVTGAANGRDLLALRNGCEPLPRLKAAFASLQSSLFGILQEEFDELEDIYGILLSAISEDAPFTIREGGIIKAGYHEELDRLRDIVGGGKDTLARIEAAEKEKTGIKNLRVSYNRVFGYYIEVSKGQTSLVPDTYIRRQTLTNAERYITPELKELESTILTAKDRINAIEYEQFCAIREFLASQAARVQRTARAIACLDVITAFADNALRLNYCRPEVDLSGDIRIEDGRHPVVEQMQKALFVPNDTLLDTEQNRTAIITGPNMAGKSTYMRQVALIVLMAQIGSFVPARSARIGMVDRIFTRIGASDDLGMGQSTFMVEMSEVSAILNHATARSLLILDEIGRGTSTFDGMAIARAVLEYVTDKRRLGAKTLFATHYHELTDLEQEIEGVKNYHICVRKRSDQIVFLRKIVPGTAEGSFGIEVAQLAGLPDRVVRRARLLLKELEEGAPVRTVTVAAQDQLSITGMANDTLRRKLENMAVETMTPIEAMNALYELKKLL